MNELDMLTLCDPSNMALPEAVHRAQAIARIEPAFACRLREFTEQIRNSGDADLGVIQRGFGVLRGISRFPGRRE